MSKFALKATHAPEKAYYATPARFNLYGYTTEGNTRSVIADLLNTCCRLHGFHMNVHPYDYLRLS